MANREGEYPRIDCLYGWCPHRIDACKTCDEIKRVENEKRVADLEKAYPRSAFTNGERE